MNIHEYQAKAVLREFGVPTSRGIPAFSVDEALKAANELGGPVWVVKAQIHAGGRGKAGGVKVVKSIDDVKKEATRILGSTLVTHQTGPKGKQVNRLYIEEGSAIDKEFYLSLLVDRESLQVQLTERARERDLLHEQYQMLQHQHQATLAAANAVTRSASSRVKGVEGAQIPIFMSAVPPTRQSSTTL